MQSIPDQFVTVNGYKTRYWELGDSGSVILLLHGFALSVDIWEQNIRELATQHRVIAVDLLGFGLTAKPQKKENVEAFPLFVSEFLRIRQINHAHIVGHSMGGLIAVRFAQMYPEKLLSLTLIASAGFARKIPIHFRILSLPVVGELFIRPNKQGLKSALLLNVFNKNLDLEPLTDKLYEYSLHPEMGKTLLKICRGAIHIFGFKWGMIRKLKAEMGKISCPVLIIWGKDDCIIYVDHAIKAHNMLPHARLEIFADCGHLPQFEYPQKFNALLLDFLSNSK